MMVFGAPFVLFDSSNVYGCDVSFSGDILFCQHVAFNKAFKPSCR